MRKITNKIILVFLILVAIVVGYLIYKTFNKNPDYIEKEYDRPITPVPSELFIDGPEPPPEGFPQDTLVYPNSRLLSREETGDTVKGEWQIEAEIPVVISWYMSHLYNKGWYMTEVPSDPVSTQRQSFKAAQNNRVLSLTATAENGGTRVELVTSISSEASSSH